MIIQLIRNNRFKVKIHHLALFKVLLNKPSPCEYFHSPPPPPPPPLSDLSPPPGGSVLHVEIEEYSRREKRWYFKGSGVFLF